MYSVFYTRHRSHRFSLLKRTHDFLLARKKYPGTKSYNKTKVLWFIGSLVLGQHSPQETNS